ncbi:bifunctional helix-turn-helix transcriptional regulator/GNAT family N-acetyltransferase [Luteibacter aegosomatissinici]|uniref:bifunctional helix-turn-helix transcriptional regulator/GNAT family N-acetyltransferase n=1 Tax=Luteibacter aegosomatissinici TaxID=2911539 RepID=UPI001FFBF346|nr:bifunctional helix-turn-helix transcriptional regulator/GNAT family N-acetyltransferase [Luteibacter aegosomatissinici]UPG94982.1 bifunctional helix-turn-helix transcriptional regulator/GNAT family N-acetyltransferase [Luteibacter aegosomatissinici]
MYLSSLRELAIGSRLKALSDYFYQAVDEVYRASGAGIESRWFPVMRFLRDVGPTTVTEVATAIGQTHSAVSQLADRLVEAGMVVRQRDPGDGRRSVLALTDAGERALGALGPVWLALRRGMAESMGPRMAALLDAIDDCEQALAEKPLVAAVLEQRAALAREGVSVVPWDPAYADHFRRLNQQWLERHFRVEDVDRALFADPETLVIKPGGAIFFALYAGEVVGTCALLHEGNGIYELSKMGVDENFRGLGAGRKLLDAAIGAWREQGGARLFLESNSRLGRALGMYERAGFRRQEAIRPGSHYERADVYMVYEGA